MQSCLQNESEDAASARLSQWSPRRTPRHSNSAGCPILLALSEFREVSVFCEG